MLALDADHPRHESIHKVLVDAMELPKPGGSSEEDKRRAELIRHTIRTLSQRYFAIPRHLGYIDVANQYARTVILAFIRDYFGIPDEYHFRLAELTKSIFQGFIGSFYARHFIDVDEEIREGGVRASALGRLLGQVLQNHPPTEDTVIHRLLHHPDSDLQLEEVLIMLGGSINGTIDNATAGVCNTLNQLFQDPHALNEATERAHDGPSDEFQSFIDEAMRLDPPAPFLPRYCAEPGDTFTDENAIVEDSDVILCIGSAARDYGDTGDIFDAKRAEQPDFLFGYGPHECVAGYLGKQLVTIILREVLKLPGLHASPDDKGKLVKQWGAITQSFGASFNRTIAHSPLNVVMKVKEPVAEHSRALRFLIRFAAPKIEHALHTVGTVHFARFLFLENDTKLALLTTYDGDFDVYINDFIEVVGDLFDQLLAHLQDAPPTPVRQHRREFIEAIREHDLEPAEGFFYSAYPNLTVKNIKESDLFEHHIDKSEVEKH